MDLKTYTEENETKTKAKAKARAKGWQILTALLFFACLLCLSVLSFTDADKNISVLEKRVLEKPPEFSAEALLSGDYARGYEAYYADQFPARDSLIALNQLLNRIYYFDFGQNAVIVERREEGGGEALADSGTDEPMPAPPSDSVGKLDAAPEPVSPPPSLPELILPAEDEAIQKGSILLIGDRAMEVPYAVADRVTRYAAAISLAAERMPGSRVISVLPPNAAEFYSPEKFHVGHYSQKDMIESVYSQMPGVLTVDAYARIREKTDQYLYFRTDHHWTARGAYQAYLAYCGRTGVEPVPLEDFEPGRYENFVGSMYGWTANLPQSKALQDNPDYVEYFLPIYETAAAYYNSADMEGGYTIPVVDTTIPESSSNKYLCFIRGDTPLCRISTPEAPDRRCIVIKESYGNAFIPFLTSHYSEIFVVDPRLFNASKHPEKFNLPDFVALHGIEDVVFINYPFMVNNKAYIEMMEKLLG